MTNAEKIISIIVPVYNVEDYLRACIESLIKQSYQKIEIILVNDGSTDSSGTICDQYALQDNRIKVIHKTNAGQSSARNIGLDIAKGDYIAFVDSDDWVDAEMYEKLVDLLEKHNADISVCGLYDFYNGVKVTNTNSGIITNYDRIAAINSLFGQKNNIRFEIWNKLFKKEVIGTFRFKQKQLFEEIYFDRQVLLHAIKIIYLDSPLYNYRKERPGNTNSHFNEVKLAIFNELDDFSVALLNNGYLDSAKRLQAYSLETTITLYLGARRLKANKTILSKLKLQHSLYHQRFSHNCYLDKRKSYFFRYLPSLYYFMFELKRKMR